ncbi:MAG: hypothetical protein E6Q97_19610 [Desulfurellales bacterium]|nr:MAG: hypothetical protein E6Q97_19610 [Desulfurellales bacterium]
MHKFFSLTNKSLAVLRATSHKELWEKAQEQGYTGLSVGCGVTIQAEVDGDQKKFHAVFSSETEDRHGEIVFQNFDLKHFRKNPVYLDSHNYWGIEHIIGRVSSISLKDGKLQGGIEFATMNPKGKLAQEMAEAGFINASSIGFIPKEFDDKGNILKSELLEISAVSVPANPEALYEGDKSKAEDTPDPAPADPTPEPIPDPVPAPVERQDVVGEVASAVRGLTNARKITLHEVSRQLAKLQDPHAEKRQVFKAVRELLKADIGA